MSSTIIDLYNKLNIDKQKEFARDLLFSLPIESLNYYHSLITQSKSIFFIRHVIALLKELGFEGDIQPARGYLRPFCYRCPKYEQEVKVDYFMFSLENDGRFGDFILSKERDGENVRYQYTGCCKELDEFVSKHAQTIFESAVKEISKNGLYEEDD